jgi:hypothetical protein
MFHCLVIDNETQSVGETIAHKTKTIGHVNLCKGYDNSNDKHCCEIHDIFESSSLWWLANISDDIMA